ncbi:twin-arginine translocase TatA/TatE family subunit [Pseudomonas sp. NCCP-436]|uniref:twin-arginine translocase TatA/TatE family subunit n=1 Tax=Pseudomonas sp. NCCP-436 TaxID=2842481 RepID=UPI001C824543|nr:twin-arginine translocase TatA/TatE family subunit [Pseudomonas sp. NCCP-436]GIZ13536.1 hypothetical protein NCCP436_29520 [Pseudomonas sp. NCCP-436]
MRIELSGTLNSLAQSLQRQNTAVPSAPHEVRDGVRLTLSELGRRLSASAASNEDIDNSDLPQAIRDLLKMIRELRQQIAEVKVEIEALMSCLDLEPDSRQRQLEALRDELGALNRALTAANANLLRLMKDNQLSDSQMMTAATLALR